MLAAPTLDRITQAAEGVPLFLDQLAWPDLAPLQEKNGGLLIIPLGATEQHGPHLPIQTDTLLAETACAYASAKTGVPVAPALAYTVSAGHTAKWPGTFSILHQTFLATLRQLAAWTAATGWRRLLFVNSHFGNDATLRAAIDQIRLAHLGELLVGARNTYALNQEIWDTFISDAADLHANRAETSLLLHLAPELVHLDLLGTSDDPDRTTGSVFSYPVAQTSLNGVTGSPSAATATEGAILFGQIGEALTDIVRRATTDEPPLGAEHWDSVPRLASSFFA
jgi:creatinine amidohydrolase